ncbi:MAG: hypothetical protein V1899_03525 [Planctomycetota bacterium]
MQLTIRMLICVVTLVWTGILRADPSGEAQTLLNESLAILKANSQREAPPEQTAQVILKLEKAQQILDSAKIEQGELPELVNNTLFWTRRFSNIHVINALDKLRASSGQVPPPPLIKKIEPPKPPEHSPEEIKDAPPLEIAGMSDAKKAFDETEQFVKNRDDYTVSLAWFRMANEHSGNDYALKALGLARDAQTRFAATKIAAADMSKKETISTPEMKLLQDGDALARAGKYEESFALYRSSLSLKETIPGHRKMAEAYYRRGQQMKDALLPKYAPAAADLMKEYNNAFEIRKTMLGKRKIFRPNYLPYVEAKRKYNDLYNQGLKAIVLYDQAALEYKAVLKMSPGNKDLDAAGHVGICMAVRGDPLTRINARQYLVKFLADYTPTTDLERSLYEFCKTELNRISTSKK